MWKVVRSSKKITNHAIDHVSSNVGSALTKTRTNTHTIPKTGNPHPYNGKAIEHSSGKSIHSNYGKNRKMDFSTVRGKQWYGEKKKNKSPPLSKKKGNNKVEQQLKDEKGD